MENKPGPVFYATAFAGVLVFFGLIWLYVREFPVLYNTIGVRRLIGVSLAVGALAAIGVLFSLRRRLTPWENHLPEVFTVLVFSILFMPLFGSLLNRAGGDSKHQSFDFLAETPYLASNYGLLKGEKIRPTGYYLDVRESGRLLRFKYTTQSYFPNTQPGDPILLPIRKGWLGFRVMELR